MNQHGFTQTLTAPWRTFVRWLASQRAALGRARSRQGALMPRRRTTAPLVSGFTLIELLVVVAIIGMLSSVVLSSLSTAREKSRDARRLADIKQIQNALELYYDSGGPGYPDALTALESDYIQSVPTDPLNENGYYYDNVHNDNTACSGSGCLNYVLGAQLEDTSHSALTGNTESTIGSVNCTNPVYCVQP